MKLIYNSLLIFSLVLIVLNSNFSQTTTYHTISIDGVNDFDPSSEEFSGTSGSNWFFTWDASNFYFGINATDVNSNNGNIWVHLYIDTDPANPITSGTGSVDGVAYMNQTPLLPFSANYHFRWKADNTYINLQVFDGNNWVDSGSSVSGYQSGTYVEFSIPLSALGDPSNIHISGSMINETGGGEYTFFMVPDNNTEGFDANYTHWYGFKVANEGEIPNSGLYLDVNLPVRIDLFQISKMTSKILIHWTTLSEVNNEKFDIYKSDDGVNWDHFQTVPAQFGRAENTIREYSILDNHPISGDNYYRLTQSDFDGTTTELGIRKIYYSPQNFVVYPNPIINSFTVRLNENPSVSTFHLTTTDGKLLRKHGIADNSRIMTMDMTDESPGIYILLGLDQKSNVIMSQRIVKY